MAGSIDVPRCAIGTPAQPAEKEDDRGCGNEWSPPCAESEGIECRRASFDEQHDRACPCECADEIQSAELEWFHARIGTGDWNGRAQARQKPADEHQSRFVRMHPANDAVTIGGQP